MLKRFAREEDGAGLVEYGLLIALVSVVLIVIVSTLGQSVKQLFVKTNQSLQSSP